MAVNQLFENAFVAYSKLYRALVDEMEKLPAQGVLHGFEIEPRMATNYFLELLMRSYGRRGKEGQRKILQMPEQILVQAEQKASEGTKDLAVAVAEAPRDSNGLIRVLVESLRPYYNAREYFPLGIRAGSNFFSKN